MNRHAAIINACSWLSITGIVIEQELSGDPKRFVTACHLKVTLALFPGGLQV